MKGFVVALRRAKNEDSIAIVLTERSIRSYYRFFGARHSILQLGHLIDFEVEGEDSRFMPRLRGLSHMGFPWLRERNRLMLWQQFIKLYYDHLKELEEVESFYIKLLDKIAKKLTRQNPYRAIIEGYVELLEHEGRLHTEPYCFVCEAKVEHPALARAFLPAHESCIAQEGFSQTKLSYLYRYKDAQFFEDSEIQRLWQTLMLGL